MENLLDKTTQLWVKLTGQRIDPEKHHWLIGPVGDADKIGDRFIDALVEKEGLEKTLNKPDYGLLDNISDLGLSDSESKKLHPLIAEFYEKTFSFHFEFWSEWCGVFRPFGWLLSVLFSRRLQQLNLPLNPMDASRGLDSNIIKLKKDGRTKWTIWYRTLKSSNQVIYSGVYTTCTPDHYSFPLLKVIFPLPNGNASVIMTRSIGDDGSLTLSSDGKKFGENGFYFTLTDKKGKYWARYVRSMHEWIRVYVDSENILRADHTLNFYGFRFLSLHYRMNKK